MDVSTVDLGVVRYALLACIAGAVLLSLVRRHAERFARARAKRALGQTDRRRRASDDS